MLGFILFLSIELVACHQISTARQRTYLPSTIQKPLYLATQSTNLPYRSPLYRETWTKRDHIHSQSRRDIQEEADNTPSVRVPRASRQYDVPQIECPPADDGMERFACPSPDRMGRYRCIDDRILCDGFIDCPNAEDEDRMSCMFYKMTKTHLDWLADALLRWARARY